MRFLFLTVLSMHTLQSFNQNCKFPKSDYENNTLDSIYGWDNITSNFTEKEKLLIHRPFLDSMHCVLREHNKTRMLLTKMPTELQSNLVVKEFLVDDGTVPVFKLPHIETKIW